MQSHNFEACNGVIRVKPGIGIVASQAGSDPFYAFASFEMLQLGKTARQTLDSLMRSDNNLPHNQVALIDKQGIVAAFTGEMCIPEAGHRTGQYYSCQANIASNKRVWAAMAKAFENSEGELVDRLMEAMEAGEQAGGDMRGAQSAVIKVVSSEPVEMPWQGDCYDFRVYDSYRPLQKLKELIKTKKAYERTGRAQRQLYEGNLDANIVNKLVEEFNEAVTMIPNEDGRQQQKCYFALSLLSNKQTDEAVTIFNELFESDPMWQELVARIAQVNPNKSWVKMLDKILPNE